MGFRHPPQRVFCPLQRQRLAHRRNQMVPVNAGDDSLKRSFAPLEMLRDGQTSLLKSRSQVFLRGQAYG